VGAVVADACCATLDPVGSVRLLTCVILTAVLVAACGTTRWVRIHSVQADSRSATTIEIIIDGCSIKVPRPRLVETTRHIHVVIDLKLDYANMNECLSAVDVQLASPIGDRDVINDRDRTTHHVTFPAPLPSTTTAPAP
jgi:hypothetical protein